MLSETQIKIISEFNEDISVMADEIVDLRYEIDEKNKRISDLEEEISTM